MFTASWTRWGGAIASLHDSKQSCDRGGLSVLLWVGAVKAVEDLNRPRIVIGSSGSIKIIFHIQKLSKKKEKKKEKKN